MKIEKVLGMLGLARRAGKLEGGYDICVDRIRLRRAKLVVAASDISEKSYKNLCFEAKRENVPARRLVADMETLSKSCGIKAGMAVITDGGFAKRIIEIIDEKDG